MDATVEMKILSYKIFQLVYHNIRLACLYSYVGESCTTCSRNIAYLWSIQHCIIDAIVSFLQEQRSILYRTNIFFEGLLMFRKLTSLI